MAKCLLKQKVTFLGLQDFNYYFIELIGKGIVVTELDGKEARQLIREGEVSLVSPSEYDSSLGKIYTDCDFKEIASEIKDSIYSILDKKIEKNE